jgi:hypothetical protein
MPTKATGGIESMYCVLVICALVLSTALTAFLDRV